MLLRIDYHRSGEDYKSFEILLCAPMVKFEKSQEQTLQVLENWPFPITFIHRLRGCEILFSEPNRIVAYDHLFS